MSDKIKIRFDMDDVLNDLSNYWMDIHHSETGERLKATQWNVHELSEFGESIYDHFTSQDFYLNVPIKDGARRTIDMVEKNPHIFDYVIVSSCRQEGSAFDYINYQKLEWCGDHLSDTARMNFVLTDEDKSEFKANIIIDDKPENIINQGCSGCLKLLFASSHNKQASLTDLREKDTDTNSKIMKVKDHKELQKILRTVLKDQSLESYLE